MTQSVFCTNHFNHFLLGEGVSNTPSLDNEESTTSILPKKMRDNIQPFGTDYTDAQSANVQSVCLHSERIPARSLSGTKGSMREGATVTVPAISLQDTVSQKIKFIVGNKQGPKGRIPLVYDTLEFYPYVDKSVPSTDWIVFGTSGCIIAMMEAGIEEPFIQCKSNFHEFFSQLFKSKPGDVVNAEEVAKKFIDLDSTSKLKSGALKVNMLFELDDDLKKNTCPWKKLMPTFTESTQCSRCIKCNNLSPLNTSNLTTICPLNLKVKAIPRKRLFTIQSLIDGVVNFDDKVKCTTKGCRSTVKRNNRLEILAKQKGIILHLEKTGKVMDLDGVPFHNADDTITFPYENELEEHVSITYKLVAGVAQSNDGICSLYFKKGYKCFKIENCQIIKVVQEDEFRKCTLLYYYLNEK